MEQTLNQPESPQAIIEDSSNKQNTTVPESNEEALLDFSSMFKKNGFTKRPVPKLGQNRKAQTSQPNWLLQIPAKLQITTKDLKQRRYMNDEKWKMIVKTSQPQNSTVCALISSINYLIKNNSSSSTALLTLNDIREKIIDQNLISNESTRRQAIFQCCQIIQKLYGIENLSTKVHEMRQEGQNKQFLNYVIQNQSNRQKAFVYICYGQILCPIGFQNTPLVPLDAYKTLGQINPQKMEMWIIFASPLKSHAPLVIKRWSDVEKEMSSRWPEYLNLDETKKGRRTWDEKGEQVITPSTKQVSCWIQLTLE